MFFCRAWRGGRENGFYRLNLVCRPLQVFLMGKLAEKNITGCRIRRGGRDKLGFTGLILFTVRFKFRFRETCFKWNSTGRILSKFAIPRICIKDFMDEEERLKSSFSSFRWAAENILWKIQRTLRPPEFAVQTRIKTSKKTPSLVRGLGFLGVRP